jgi:phage gpG-like protein
MSIQIVKDTISPMLDKLELTMGGMRMNTRISNIMLRDTQRHFIDEMGPDGPWPPLAEITIRNRRKMSDTPLRDTNQLFQSAHITPTDSEAAVTWSKYDYDFGINVAKLQNNGGIGKIRNPDGSVTTIRVPRREFAWLSRFAIREIEALPVEVVRDL